MSAPRPRGPRRIFGLIATAVGVAIACAILLLLVAWWQGRADEPMPIPLPMPELAETLPGRVELDLEVVQLMVEPLPAGSPPRLEARFDPDRFELEQDHESTTASWTWKIRLAPSGSSTMAFLRAKTGAPLAQLRLGIPADLPFELVGKVRLSIVAAELGGTTLRGVDLAADDGAVKLSFLSPTAESPERIRILGDRGLVEATGVGFASPSEIELRQSMGLLHADLRGPWRGDAVVNMEAKFTGGTVWLPSDVEIEGPEAPPRFLDAEEGLRPITLRLRSEAFPGRMVVMR